MYNTQDLLKKINYIEADIEIQKQILFAIPSDQREEMEKIIKIIAAKKEEIDKLRKMIQEEDPEEFARILALEQAISEFKILAADKKFSSITGRNIGEDCLLTLQDGERIDCLVKACDAAGDWTVITLDGKIRHFPGASVQ